ncbi:matrix-remodeling-associated protein 7 isoform X1 [Astyanax mexicanus]|uniref:matrix-remodeling-associated protein 7 isoform X1 n=1 Tax=Astyanax mexicanus TaxID=7994 RepID=UPI000BBD5ED5|nr:matrix-remodeling-associated protein 7 isoform X1 [Astyanax mexicanus]
MMDLSPDLWFLLPAVLFTLLAVVTGALVLRKTAGSNKPGQCCAPPRPQGALSHCRETEDKQVCSQVLLSGERTGSESKDHQEEEHFKLQQTNTANTPEAPAAGNDESADIPSVKKGCEEEKPLRYRPGMLRTSQLEKMMSKEELEEERRVQREQLIAIFKLLQDNQEAFGEVTENDMEEQLKLYSI